MRGVIANFHVNMSPRLPSQTLKHKLGSEVKISGKKTNPGSLVFSKPKCPQFLYKTDSYTSKNMLGTKNVRYGGIFKATKKTLLYQTNFICR